MSFRKGLCAGSIAKLFFSRLLELHGELRGVPTVEFDRESKLAPNSVPLVETPGTRPMGADMI
jgi:hypothetical protein